MTDSHFENEMDCVDLVERVPVRTRIESPRTCLPQFHGHYVPWERDLCLIMLRSSARRELMKEKSFLERHP